MIMLSEFRRQKITKEFNFLDTNADGLLGKVDFELGAARLAEAMGWDKDSDEFKALLKERCLAWEELCLAADFDQSGSVDLPEYQEFYERMTANMGSDPAKAPVWFRRVCAAHVESMDLDGDQKITAEDYARFIKAHNYSGFDVQACFEVLDLDGNGHLDKDECVLLCLQFYLSEDTTLPGNSIWGPLSNK